MMDYYSILTRRGKALEARVAADGAAIVLRDFVVGDGNGKAVMPDPERTELVNEVYRGTISSLDVSPDQENQFIASLALPADSGGYTVREVGLLTDNGELYAVANCAAIEKPARGISINMQFRLAVSETTQIELKVATGDGLFLRQDANLSDVKDKDKSRENLGLRSAAVVDVQTSKDDITAGRVVMNGGALALRSVLARAAGGDYTDTNLLPANSVSFVYSDAANSPGFVGSLIDYAGHKGEHRVQIAASYQDGGKKIKFRTFNDDQQKAWNAWYEFYHTGNKPTAADTGALPTTGGTMTGVLSVSAHGKGSYASQNGLKAPVYQEVNTTAASEYWPIVKQKNIQENATWSMGQTVKEGHWHLHFISGSKAVNALFTWRTDGQFIPASYINFDTRYSAKGSSYTKAESDARYSPKNTAVKTPNSLIWRCGSTGVMEIVMSNIAVGNNATKSITFPSAFPNACVGVVITYDHSGHGHDMDSSYGVPKYSRTGCVIRTTNSNGKFMLIAKGY